MVLIIDNYDSFTYNLYQQIARLGYEVVVKKHDEVDIAQIETLGPSHIIISAGPKRPKDSGVSLQVIKNFYTRTPILGVCLGHQCIGEVFGSTTVNAPVIVHGKTDAIRHEGQKIFKGVPNPLIAARYNSLVIDKVPDEFMLLARSDDNTIQAIAHKKYPVYGVQFHPESFMTEQGDVLMRNFLACTI